MFPFVNGLIIQDIEASLKGYIPALSIQMKGLKSLAFSFIE